MRRVVALALLAGCTAAWVGGCEAYYRVTDTNTDRVYYTDDLHRTPNGSVRIADGRTGDEVTLQNSKIRRIDRSEFYTGRAKSGERPDVAVPLPPEAPPEAMPETPPPAAMPEAPPPASEGEK
jgi:hypothetical protein